MTPQCPYCEERAHHVEGNKYACHSLSCPIDTFKDLDEDEIALPGDHL